MFRTLLSLTAAALLIAVQPPVAAAAAQEKDVKNVKSAAPPAAKPGTASVNINTASATELERLPGIGGKTAARIIEYRQKNGPFKKVEELMNVRGVGEKSFLKLKSQLTVAASKTDPQ